MEPSEWNDLVSVILLEKPTYDEMMKEEGFATNEMRKRKSFF